MIAALGLTPAAFAQPALVGLSPERPSAECYSTVPKNLDEMLRAHFIAPFNRLEMGGGSHIQGAFRYAIAEFRPGYFVKDLRAPDDLLNCLGFAVHPLVLYSSADYTYYAVAHAKRGDAKYASAQCTIVRYRFAADNVAEEVAVCPSHAVIDAVTLDTKRHRLLAVGSLVDPETGWLDKDQRLYSLDLETGKWTTLTTWPLNNTTGLKALAYSAADDRLYGLTDGAQRGDYAEGKREHSYRLSSFTAEGQRLSTNLIDVYDSSWNYDLISVGPYLVIHALLRTTTAKPQLCDGKHPYVPRTYQRSNSFCHARDYIIESASAPKVAAIRDAQLPELITDEAASN